MPVEITITVRDKVGDSVKTLHYKYDWEYLQYIPQGHIQMWNEMIRMIEEVKSVPPIEVKKTSEDWYNEIYPNKELIILDPDGWDRRNWDFSWGEEEVTKEEFNRRLCLSTINNIKTM